MFECCSFNVDEDSKFQLHRNIVLFLNAKSFSLGNRNKSVLIISLIKILNTHKHLSSTFPCAITYLFPSGSVLRNEFQYGFVDQLLCILSPYEVHVVEQGVVHGRSGYDVRQLAAYFCHVLHRGWLYNTLYLI